MGRICCDSTIWRIRMRVKGQPERFTREGTKKTESEEKKVSSDKRRAIQKRCGVKGREPAFINRGWDTLKFMQQKEYATE